MILGAGCAGLSLAWNLIERGFEEPILIVDRRERFDNDRTWCFWDMEPTPFSDLATHSWSRWMVHDGHRETTAVCEKYSYLRLRSIDFYQRVLERLASAPNVTLALGQPIVGVTSSSQGVKVATMDNDFVGLRAFDSSTQRSKEAGARSGHHRASLLQHFFGQTIRVDRPIFETSCPSLMDFRASQDDGPHFFYLLPLSSTEALVENTYFLPLICPAERHRIEICDYLQMRYGLKPGDFVVTEEESGAIPMTTARRETPRGSRVTPIGLAGGAARPSSGYAFLRIQRQARELAEKVVSGKIVNSADQQKSLSRSKYTFFDTIFLQVLADRPELAPQIFGRMFDQAAPVSVVQFLGDRSTLLDDLKIVAALPKLPFIEGAMRSIRDWLPAVFGR
jgi:lycopene beta-cyclase